MSTGQDGTAVDLIAGRLARAGCRHAFGIPGGEVIHMMDALQRAGIDFTLCKHENGGGFMAEGTHQATGAPGILLATIGPGLANGVNAIVNAHQDQVPLVVLTGCVDGAEAATYTHQVFDHSQLLRPVVKDTVTVADGAVDVAVDKAVSLALSDPMGPVHLDIPVSLANRAQPAPRRADSPLPGPVVPGPGPWLEAARAKLAAAQRPLLVAGMGALHHGAGAEILRVCETYSMPLITTYKAKGLIPETHPLCLGGHGLSPKSDALLLPLFAEADLILAVGYDPIEMRTGWRDPWDPDKVIELAHCPPRHGMHGAALSTVCDGIAGLRVVTDGVAPAAQPWPCGRPAEVRAALRAVFADSLVAEPDQPWGPRAAFAAARRGAPDTAVITADSGAHRILLSQMWDCPTPRTLLQSSALCTMGCALPLAIGQKLAAPDVPVLAFMGDAGLEMILGELATLRDLRLPVGVVVVVDESLALIELKQRRSGLGNLGVDFPPTDFVKLAEAMGGVGVLVKDAETMAAECAALHDRETFTLLACQVPRKAYDGLI
ncbi:MAG: thiamine pyrophosphate-binding protein [Rhodospirillaceae bacterium]